MEHKYVQVYCYDGTIFQEMLIWLVVITNRAWWALSGISWACEDMAFLKHLSWSYWKEVFINYAIRKWVGEDSDPLCDANHGMPCMETELFHTLVVYSALHARKFRPPLMPSIYMGLLLVALPISLVYTGNYTFSQVMVGIAVGAFNAVRRYLLYWGFIEPFFFHIQGKKTIKKKEKGIA